MNCFLSVLRKKTPAIHKTKKIFRFTENFFVGKKIFTFFFGNFFEKIEKNRKNTKKSTFSENAP